MTYNTDDLKDLFNRVNSILVDAGKTVADTAKTTVDTAPLLMKIREKENYLEKQYFELGVLYYQNHVNDENPEFEQLKRIGEIQEELRALRDEMAQKKGKDCCPECGEFIEKNAKFCHHCGAKLPDETFEEESAYEEEGESFCETDDQDDDL